MKKLIITAGVLISLLFVAPAYSTDIQVTVTIPLQYVANLTAMVQDKYMYHGSSDCTGLTVKECFEKMCIKEAIRKEYRQWKHAQDMEAATGTVSEQNIEVEVE